MENFEYSGSIVVPISREKLLPRVSNPLFFVGLTGHILILRAYDRETKAFVPLSTLSLPSDRFRVVYAYGLCDGEISPIYGYLEKAGETRAGVTYRGMTDDGGVSWEATIELLPASTKGTKLEYSITAHYDPSVRSLEPSKFDVTKFIEHIMKTHVEPAFRFYYTELEAESLNVDVALVRSMEGFLSDIILKALDYIEGMKLGVVKIEGEGIVGTLVVKDGEIQEIRVVYNGKTLSNDEAVDQLMDISSPVRVSMYSVDTESLVKAIMVGTPLGGGVEKEIMRQI